VTLTFDLWSSNLEAVFTANHFTDADKQNKTVQKNAQTKYNLKSKQHKIHENKTTLVQLPLRHWPRKRDGLIL